MNRRAQAVMDAEFMHRLAHELRSPISPISQALELVDDELGPARSDRLRKATTLAGGAVRRFERLAARLDLMADLESGASDLGLQRSDFVAIVERGVDLCRALEGRREVVLTCDLMAAPCHVRANPDRLACVVTELVHNAIRHARRRVLVRLERVGAAARFSVEDDGKGVAKDRVGVPLPAGRSGLGLGLSIVSEIVRAHDGRLTCGDSTFPGFDPGTVGASAAVSLDVVA